MESKENNVRYSGISYGKVSIRKSVGIKSDKSANVNLDIVKVSSIDDNFGLLDKDLDVVQILKVTVDQIDLSICYSFLSCEDQHI